jgi:hypothetical protein
MYARKVKCRGQILDGKEVMDGMQNHLKLT